MNKKSYKVVHYHNPDIKVDDEVFLVDGSALTFLHDDEKHTTNNYYITERYPLITGNTLLLKEIKAKVINININDRVALGPLSAYVQDLIVQIGNAQFRTCSDFVCKV